MPGKPGGGGGGGWAQSNFPTRDHQNIFNLILTYICFVFFVVFFGTFIFWGGAGAGAQALIGSTAMQYHYL